MSAARSLPAELAEQIAALSSRVARDGLDAHQAAAYELAWAVARDAAAAATEDWAAATGQELPRLIAASARWESDQGLQGAALPEVVLEGERLAALARAYRPVEEAGDGEEQRLLRATFRDFARHRVQPLAQAIHRENLDIPESIIGGAAALGLFGLSVPEEYGGSQTAEPDHRAMLIVTEELSRASLGAGGSLITRPEILVRALLRGGTEDQRRRWLPAIASGEKLVAVAVTEPDAGSDVASLDCRAERQPDGGWLIQGSKLWSTFAGRSELLMLLCRTGPAGHRGLSAFVAEKPRCPGESFQLRQPGGGSLSGRAIPTLGYRGMHTFELAFDRYLLPAEALIGGEEWLDRGFYLQMEGFSQGRLQTAGRAVGVMQAAFDAALAYCRARSVFGGPIAGFQQPQAMLGRMAVRVSAARRLSYRAADLLNQGSGDAQMVASLAKLYASRMAEMVTRDAMQLHGGMGYGEETDVSRYFVDARVLAIFEGAEEVLAIRVIAKSLLG